MIFTINQLNRELQEIQAAHLQLNSYYWGDFIKAWKNNTLIYPLMCSYYVNGGGASNMLVPINLVVVIADKVFKDDSNLNDVESDSLQICKDLVNVMSFSARWQSFSRFNSYTIDKFIQRGGDEVAGHVLRVNISLKDTKSICSLPMQGYDFDQTFGLTCAPVFVTDSDGTTTFEIPSGGSFVCTPVAPATVRNSVSSYETTVAPGATLTLPNITITLAGGTETAGSPSVQDIELLNYYYMNVPTGIRVPVNTVVDPDTEVEWFNLLGSAVTSAGRVEKTGPTGSWDTAANAMIPTNGEFYVEFNLGGDNTFGGFTGLADLSANYASIGAAFYISGGLLYVYSYGFYLSGAGAYSPTDLFRIERVNGKVRYIKNGVLIIEQTLASDVPFSYGYSRFDCAIATQNGYVENIKIGYL